MDIDGYTTVGFRIRSTDRTQHSNDVGVLLPDKVHHGSTHDTNESEVQYVDGYKHKINRSAKADATRFKGVGSECGNIS